MSAPRSTRFIFSPHFLDEADPELRTLRQEDWTMVEPEILGTDTQQRMISILSPLSDAVRAAVQAGHVPVTIAGDCCATIGVLAGLQRAGIDPTLMWFDAHGDFNTWDTSPSGFLGGMPLAMITGRGEQTMPDAVGLTTLADTRVVLTDGRDLDREERELLQDSDVTMVPDVGDLLTTPLPGGPLYVHFDTDVISADEVPAQRYPVGGGPNSATISTVFRHLAASGRVAGFSMSAWHAGADHDGTARETCMTALAALTQNLG